MACCQLLLLYCQFDSDLRLNMYVYLKPFKWCFAASSFNSSFNIMLAINLPQSDGHV